MSKKRSSRNTKSVKRSLKRKRGGVVRQDYRQGGHVKRVGVYNGGNYFPKPDRDDYPTGADYNTAMSNWYAAGGPQQNINTNQAQPRLGAHEGQYVGGGIGEGTWVPIPGHPGHHDNEGDNGDDNNNTSNQPQEGDQRTNADGTTSTYTNGQWVPDAQSTIPEGTIRVIDGVTKVFTNGQWVDQTPYEERGDVRQSEEAQRLKKQRDDPTATTPQVQAATTAAPDYDAFAADITKRMSELPGGDTSRSYTYDEVTGQIVQTYTDGRPQTSHGTPEEFAAAGEFNLEGYMTAPEGTISGEAEKVTSPGPVTGGTATATGVGVTKGTAQEGTEQDAVSAGEYTAEDAEDLDETTAAQGTVSKTPEATTAGMLEEGYSFTPPKDGAYPSVMPPEGKRWAYGPGGERIAVDENITERAAAAGRDTTQEAAAKMTAAERRPIKTRRADGREITWEPDAYGGQGAWVSIHPTSGIRQFQQPGVGGAPERPAAGEYAEAATTDEEFVVEDIDDPAVRERILSTITEEERELIKKEMPGRETDLKAILEKFPDIQKRFAQTGTFAKRTATELGLAPQEEAATAKFYGADYTPEAGGTEIDEIPAFKKAAEREAQVQEAAQGIAAELGEVPSVDLEGREAITGTAPQGNAAQIGGVPTMAAAQMESVKGEARSVAAADMMAVVANMPTEITAAISEDPAEVTAQLDTDPDPEVTAALAALPEEALVSTQMSKLLEGMEEGQTPLWARPAVAQVEQMMAQRGLSVSTVGRDALFNAIIQSALPMAQSNAQALQQTAQQHLSNQQQANLASAQQKMQVRMQNLANRQTSASQTAQMAQQIRVQQGQFRQEAVMTTAAQRQQTELTNAQMAQQRAQQESAQKQQAAISTLDSNTRMDLANLQAESMRAGRQLDADQQARLQTYQAQVNKVMRQADYQQRINEANLGAELQTQAINLNNRNLAARDTMTALQQEELKNIDLFVDFKKTNASFVQQMEMANLSNRQQMRLVELQDKVATDTANFTADNQFELAELTAKVQRATRQAELDARLEEVNLDSELKVELAELSERNTTSRANMTAEQQMRLTNLNNLVDFRKTNAAMAQQMDLANMANEQQMEMAMLADRSATDAANMTEENRRRMASLSTAATVLSQNTVLLQQADAAQFGMEEKVALANLTHKNAADAQSMTAENTAELQTYEKRMQAGQLNAQLAQQMGLANLSNEQSAAMFNAQVDANMDMKQFDFDQQAQLANSQFMQTMTVKDFDARQTAAMQNATAMAQMDMQAADLITRSSIENARNFLQMDMANLNANQQGKILDQQMRQQRLLSNQSAANAAEQFNATSQNQINQFNTSMAQNMSQFNATQVQTMSQFNASEANRAEAITAQNETDISKFNAQILTQTRQFNAQLEQQREIWNATNAQAVEQSNVEWRRKSNTIDTAAQNAVNQQNAQNAFAISQQAQSQLWQEVRDVANRNFTRELTQNERAMAMINSALSSEAFMTESVHSAQRTKLFSLIAKLIPGY